MGADLESAMMNSQLDLYGEFSAIWVALQIGPDSGARDTRDNYMGRYGEWIRAASDPDSVENLYANNDLSQGCLHLGNQPWANNLLLRFDAERGEIRSSPIPQGVKSLLGSPATQLGKLARRLACLAFGPRADQSRWCWTTART